MRSRAGLLFGHGLRVKDPPLQKETAKRKEGFLVRCGLTRNEGNARRHVTIAGPSRLGVDDKMSAPRKATQDPPFASEGWGTLQDIDRLCEAFRGGADDGCYDLIHALEVSVLEDCWVFQAEAEGAIKSDVGEPD